MHCDDCQNALPEFSLGQLDPSEFEQVRAHLETGCSDCNRYLAEINEAWADYTLADPEQSPPQHVEAELLNRLAEAPQEKPAPSTSVAARRHSGRLIDRPLPPRFVAAVLTIAATVAVAAFIGVVNYNRAMQRLAESHESQILADARIRELQSNLESADRLRQAFNSPNLRLFSLHPSGDGGQTHGYLIWDVDASEWHVFAFDLPPLPAGQTYRLAYSDADAPANLAMPLTPDEQGVVTAVIPAPAPVEHITRVAIVATPANGSGDETSEIIVWTTLDDDDSDAGAAPDSDAPDSPE